MTISEVLRTPFLQCGRNTNHDMTTIRLALPLLPVQIPLVNLVTDGLPHWPWGRSLKGM